MSLTSLTITPVLSHARWSSLQASKILLGVLVGLLSPGLPILIGIDETIERRKGDKIATDLELTPIQIVEWFVLRWGVEVTFEEVRAHLGVETQRQWSDLAIARTTPALLGLFSLVCLMATRLSEFVEIIPEKASWYPKSQVTFSDILTIVRRQLWRAKYLVQSTPEAEYLLFAVQDWESLIDRLATAA